MVDMSFAGIDTPQYYKYICDITGKCVSRDQCPRGKPRRACLYCNHMTLRRADSINKDVAREIPVVESEPTPQVVRNRFESIDIVMDTD
jgi:hypothetical protein